MSAPFLINPPGLFANVPYPLTLLRALHNKPESLISWPVTAPLFILLSPRIVLHPNCFDARHLLQVLLHKASAPSPVRLPKHFTAE